MKVAAVGFVCIDFYENLNRLYPTGNGVDFLINLMKYGGVEGLVVSAVGNDPYGELMRSTFIRRGIDVSHLHTESGSTAVIKMNLKGNDRVHGERIRGVMDHFSLTDEDIAFIKGCDLIHTDLSGRVTAQLPAFKADGARVVFDFSVRYADPGNEKILPYVDYALFSFGEIQQDVTDFLRWAQGFGPRVVIATLGTRGSIAYDGQRFYKEGIVPADTVNTVGAGDSFAAGFIHGVICHMGIQDCLRCGAELASKIVGQFEPY